MGKRLEGKLVAITGSAGGLGRAFALAFAREGANIILVDVNEAGNAETKKLVEELGQSASAYRVDLSKEADIKDFAAAVLAQHDSIDVLINNAGLAYGEIARGFADLSMDKWLFYFSINTVAPLLLAQALRPALAKAKGLIINQSSMASYAPATAYGVTKASLTAMNYGMASQFAADEIRAVAIAPGLMETEANLEGLDEATHTRIKGMQMVRRGGKAEDIANLGVFLAAEGNFINNEIVIMDGGNHMRGYRP